MNRRNLLKTSALAWAAPALAKTLEMPMPKLGSVLHLLDVKLLDGEVWRPQKQAAGTLVVYWWAS